MVRRGAAVVELQSCAERFTGHRTPSAEQCRGGDPVAEVEGDAHVVTAAVDLVDHVEGTRRTVQPDRAAVPGGGLECQVAIVLGGPFGGVAVIPNVDLPGVRMTQPQERT